MLIIPDNIVYFSCIFASAIFFGTYLLFSYRRNLLLVLNSLGFGLCAVRATTEYYLPQVSSFQEASNIAAFHSVLVHIISFIIWTCLFFYLRPFRSFKKEKIINFFFFLFVYVLPGMVSTYVLATRKIFFFHETRIDGFWQFKAFEGPLIPTFFFVYNYIFMGLLVVGGLFLHNIIVDKNDRIKKILLTLFFFSILLIYTTYFNNENEENWHIPNSAIIYLLQLIILSWYVSGYRMFSGELEEMTKDVLNSFSDLAVTTDEKLNIINMNSQAKEILYYNGIKTLPNLITSNTSLAINDTLTFVEKLMKGDQFLSELEVVDQHGKTRFFNAKAASLSKSGFSRGYTFIFSDLTQIKEKTEKLNELNRTKDQLFSVIAHDLRRPSLAFRGISKKINYLLKEKEFDNLKKLCNSLEQSAFSLSNLIDNLLNWALSQKKALQINPSEFDPSKPILNTFKLYQPLAEDKSITFKLNIEPNLNISLDLQHFMTICRNLIDNAYKFTSPGGIISISTSTENNNFNVLISDTGVGMTKDKIEHFFELSSLNSTKGTGNELGSGLGLMLVKELVALNNGIITLNSEIGKGTSFNIKFTDCISSEPLLGQDKLKLVI